LSIKRKWKREFKWRELPKCAHGPRIGSEFAPAMLSLRGIHKTPRYSPTTVAFSPNHSSNWFELEIRISSEKRASLHPTPLRSTAAWTACSLQKTAPPGSPPGSPSTSLKPQRKAAQPAVHFAELRHLQRRRRVAQPLQLPGEPRKAGRNQHAVIHLHAVGGVAFLLTHAH
jgi:hypothetical protein